MIISNKLKIIKYKLKRKTEREKEKKNYYLKLSFSM